MINYTVEDLVLYLYKETSSKTTASIENELQSNWALREKLSVLKASMERLSTIIKSPRAEAVLNIMKYASEKTIVPSVN